MENTISQFKQTLKQLDREYILLSSLPSTKIHFKFLGKFEGREVIWNTQIIALKHSSNQPLANFPMDKNSYLEIESAEKISNRESELMLCVGLPIEIITTPVLQKTMIMIQNYKRLRRGRHIFGEV